MATAGGVIIVPLHSVTAVTANDVLAAPATEEVVITAVAALVTGRIYTVQLKGLTESNVAGDRMRARLRQDSLTGTVMDLADIPLGGASSPVRFWLEEEYTASGTGNKTFVGTLVRAAGTGTTVQLSAAATYRTVLTVNQVL